MQSVKQTCFLNTVEFSRAERAVFKRRERLPPSVWAERHRVVTKGNHAGPWRNAISPHLAPIMDTWALPYVREVVICKSPQSGGTEVIYNCAGSAMDQDPSHDHMFIMSSQELSRTLAEERLIPMLKKTPRLRRLLSDDPDDTAKKRIRLKSGTSLYMAWSNSSSSLAAVSAKYIYFDETDKYPPTVGKETDPISLGEKRARAFRYTSKFFKVSSPTRQDGPIWTALKSCEVEYAYHLVCPFCDAEQAFDFDRIIYPADTLGEQIERELLARYQCAHCDCHLDDRHRDMAIRRGGWRIIRGAGIKRPRSVGYHQPSWISTDVSLSEIAAAKILGESDPAKQIDYYNDYRAEPYIPKLSERREDAILALRDTRPAGLVPTGTAFLLAIIDTQKRGFFYEVRAVGWGPSLETWQVRLGFVETFAGLKEILCDSEYRDVHGVRHIIGAAFIDSGGGTGTVPHHSRTAEVYDFCRSNPLVRPVKGRQTMTQPWSTTHLDYFPGTKKPIPGGLTLYLLNVTYFKDQLATKLSINPDDPGAWHLHAECPQAYARQMTAEYKDTRGWWQCPQGKANHYWDIGVYTLAAAEILRIKYLKKPEPEIPAPSYRAKTDKKSNDKNGRW